VIFLRKKFFLFPLLIFILFQFTSIYFRLYNTSCPIGIDDSDSYIFRIDLFRHAIQSGQDIMDILNSKMKLVDNGQDAAALNEFYGSVVGLPLGAIAAIFKQSSQDVFHINFYLGILFACFVLYLTFSKFSNPKQSIYFGFLLFAFYTGQGTYHGFFWVVPSFFCIVFWLLLFRVLFHSERYWIYLPIPCFFALFSHPSSILAFTILGFCCFFLAFLTRDVRGYFARLLCLGMVSAVYLCAYKYLLASGKIIPLFLEGASFGDTETRDVIVFKSTFEPVVNFEGGSLYQKIEFLLTFFFNRSSANVKILCGTTPFLRYLCFLAPLTVWSTIRAFRTREYPILALFLSSLLFCCVITLYHGHLGRRAFYFLEVSILLLYTIGFRDVYFCLKNKTPINKQRLIRKFVYCPIFTLFILVVLGNLYSLGSTALSQKIYCKRYIDQDALKKFVLNDKSIIATIGGVESIYKMSSMNLGWDKNVVTQSMLRSLNSDTDNVVYLAENYKYFYTSTRRVGYERSGIKASLPPGCALILTNDASGLCKIDLEDSGLSPTEVENLSIETVTNNEYKNINLANWETRQMQIEFPFEKEIPFQNLSSIIIHLLQKIERNVFIVRNSFKLTSEVFVPGNSDTVVLKNNSSNSINICGTIRIRDGDGVVKTIDFDRGATSELRGLKMVLGNGKEYLLPWTIPGQNELFELQANFWDIKFVKRYPELSMGFLEIYPHNLTQN